MSAHVAEARFIETATTSDSISANDAPTLAGDREGVAAARGILIGLTLSMPVWLVLGIIVCHIL